jgi:transposase InsO family protein
MRTENITWGAERIRGELLKLGIKVSKRTIHRYLPPETAPSTSPSNQNWGTFLRNHADQIWSCDFTQTYNLFFAPLFVFVIIELSSRRIVHTAVTAHPTDAWVAQQLREATPWGEHPRFLIRDNDSKYGPHFAAVAAGSGIEVIRTPVRAPNANSHVERFLGSLRRECLDHMLILNERHLSKVVREYADYFNRARPHQGIRQAIPVPPKVEQPQTGKIIAFPVLGGLHHDYRRAA